MEYIQKPTASMHGNRCCNTAERNGLAILLLGGYLLPPAVLSLHEALPHLLGTLCRKQKEACFDIGSTSKVRKDLQEHQILEKFRLAGTAGGLLQTPLKTGWKC